MKNSPQQPRKKKAQLASRVMLETLICANKEYNRIPLTVLAVLDGLGRSASPWELAKILGVTQGCVAQQLNRLCFLGFVEREGVNFENGVFRPYYRGTEKGEKFLDEKKNEIIKLIESEERWQ